jgi:hypothetical protein
MEQNKNRFLVIYKQALFCTNYYVYNNNTFNFSRLESPVESKSSMQSERLNFNPAITRSISFSCASDTLFFAAHLRGAQF